jgi:hypothetical protein
MKASDLSASGGLVQNSGDTIVHFDIYFGDNFEKAVSDQLAFLEKHLVI